MSEISNNDVGATSIRWSLPACDSNDTQYGAPLLQLPRELLECILLKLDVVSLALCLRTCTAFARKEKGGLSIVEKVAKQRVRQIIGVALSERFRLHRWLHRLFIETCATGFDQQRGTASGFSFKYDETNQHLVQITLDGMGPRLLVSDSSTAESSLLRWRLAVRGNTAVEFGVVPVSLQDDSKALHKCQSVVNCPVQPLGMCSSITVGSQLFFKCPLMKGSVVEMMADRRSLSFIVHNPDDGTELVWHNTRTVPKAYTGPHEIRMEMALPAGVALKLALTSWAHGCFDVLHTSGCCAEQLNNMHHHHQQQQQGGGGAEGVQQAAGGDGELVELPVHQAGLVAAAAVLLGMQQQEEQGEQQAQ